MVKPRRARSATRLYRMTSLFRREPEVASKVITRLTRLVDSEVSRDHRNAIGARGVEPHPHRDLLHALDWIVARDLPATAVVAEVRGVHMGSGGEVGALPRHGSKLFE